MSELWQFGGSAINMRSRYAALGSVLTSDEAQAGHCRSTGVVMWHPLGRTRRRIATFRGSLRQSMHSFCGCAVARCWRWRLIALTEIAREKKFPTFPVLV